MREIYIFVFLILLISCKSENKHNCDLEKLYNTNYRKKMNLPILDNFEKEKSKDWKVVLINKDKTKTNYLYKSEFHCRSQGEFFTFILDSVKYLKVNYGHFSNDISVNISLDSIGIINKKISIHDYKKLIDKYPNLKLPRPLD